MEGRRLLFPRVFKFLNSPQFRGLLVGDQGVGTSGRRMSTFRYSHAPAPRNSVTICVEGNIGSGKTTFLRRFKECKEICVLDEPIQKWRDVRGHNLLDLMYKDPTKWSLCFQSYVQLTMLDLHTKPVTQPLKMMERSIYSAKYCFVENLYKEGLMQGAEYEVLTEWFDFARERMPMQVDLIVYLQTDPEVAYRRILKRGRSEENTLQMEYLRKVHQFHEDWLVNGKNNLPCPVLKIDANKDLSDMGSSFIATEDAIKKQAEKRFGHQNIFRQVVHSL